MEVGRSLAETPTWAVASVTTVMVFVCFLVERSIYRFGKWLKKTRRKALFSSLEKIKEELMLLGLISLMLGQWARWISEICVGSSLFNGRFYLCSEQDFNINKNLWFMNSFSFSNDTDIPPNGANALPSHQCGEGREPFVSQEGLEQLHRFLFVLGITHVLYSCLAVGMSMSKIYSWRKWENQATLVADGSLQVKINKVMRRQSTFVFHYTSHPWSRSRVLIWMLCFLRQFKSSMQKSDYLALRLGFITNHKLPLSYNFHKYMVRSMEDEFHGIVGVSFLKVPMLDILMKPRILPNSAPAEQMFSQLRILLIPLPQKLSFVPPDVFLSSWPLWGYAIICIFINIHGLNIYFWLSFIPAILMVLVGTKLQHVVSSLALEIGEQKGPQVGNQVKPRDELFWFGKPEILLRLIQFIIFQNAFEMATFIWSLWGFKQQSCFMKNHVMIIIRLASGVLVQFWCSYCTVPLNLIITQMGSRCKKALVAESVRESLHSWCKRVKERSKRDSMNSRAARSVCSLESTIDERDEIITVGSGTLGSGTLSRCSSLGSLNEENVASTQQLEGDFESSAAILFDNSFRHCSSQPTIHVATDDVADEEEEKVQTLLDLFQKT